MSAIHPLLERGRRKYDEFLANAYANTPAPVGAHDVAVVRTDDFVQHTEICLAYVKTDRPLYILAPDGSITALLCRHRSGAPK